MTLAANGITGVLQIFYVLYSILAPLWHGILGSCLLPQMSRRTDYLKYEHSLNIAQHHEVLSGTLVDRLVTVDPRNEHETYGSGRRSCTSGSGFFSLEISARDRCELDHAGRIASMDTNEILICITTICITIICITTIGIITICITTTCATTIYVTTICMITLCFLAV